MKLGGWHRLWIFLSVIYLLVVIIFAIYEFPPKAEDTPHKHEFFQKLSIESREMISDKNIYDYSDFSNEWDWADIYEHVKSISDLEKQVQRLIDLKVPEKQISEFIQEQTVSEQVKEIVLLSRIMPNGRRITFKKGISDEQMNTVAKEYMDILSQEASEPRASFMLNVFLIWIIPCLSLYAIGWSIRWFFRGFKSG